jgi:outer membrane lipoprotein-sorting protein
MSIKKFIGIAFLLFFFSFQSNAQTNPLIDSVTRKLALVRDYVAEGKMKTNVSFIKASLGKVKVYFKYPNLLKIKKEGGISLLPKGGLSLTINSLLNTKQYIALPMPMEVYNGKHLKVLKLVATDEKLDWVISTLWIDPITALVYKTSTTTKDNGSFDISMEYGNYANYGLPSKIIFAFNTKDYKLPNGITLEFGDDDAAAKQKAMQNKKGTIEITYTNYVINNGASNSMF